MTNLFTQDPDAVLDYGFDWSDWLAATEIIASSTVTVSTGITLDSTDEDAGVVTAWVSGGTAGQKYTATCHIVTNQGREDDRTITIKIKER